MPIKLRSRATAESGDVVLADGVMDLLLVAGNVRDGVDRGDGTEGTLVLPATSVVKSGEQYGAGGTEYTGSYPTTETSYAAGAAAQYVMDVTAVEAVKAGITTTTTLLGVVGTLNMALYCLISEITWPAENQVLIDVQFGPVTGEEYTGTMERDEVIRYLALVLPSES